MIFSILKAMLEALGHILDRLVPGETTGVELSSLHTEFSSCPFLYSASQKQDAIIRFLFRKSPGLSRD